ncbi:hypothetical protein HOY81_26870, partial [Streptomyces sp. JJ36]|nr:hypothetical protein [Streptomyces sp. JJ36]
GPDGAAPDTVPGHAPGDGPGARRVTPAARGLRGCRSLVRSLARPAGLLGSRDGPGVLGGLGGLGGGLGALAGLGGLGGQPLRLRVEADGRLLADLDKPVAGLSLAPAGDGLAAITVRGRSTQEPVRARAHRVTVSGPDFRYRADAVIGGPVRVRTWTVLPGALRLTLPGNAL